MSIDCGQKNIDLIISGIGVTSAVGQGKNEFIKALLEGRTSFDYLKRAGRQNNSSFIGAEIQNFSFSDVFSKRLLRTISFTEQVALITLLEAWNEAKLENIDPKRIGLVIGGSNFQQRSLMLIQEEYRNKPAFINPNYALSFLDTDLCGVITEFFGIKGPSYTIGGASASGQLAVIQAAQAVLSNQVDVCIALGAMMDLSFWELHAFRALGAMGTDKYADAPLKACRPFDKGHDGFIYGESCGAIVIEKSEDVSNRNISPYAAIKGWGVVMDGNRNPNPSYDGEKQVIEAALKMAELKTEAIDYINPHGTGSVIGDETELKAFQDLNLSHAYINATKSITGHGISSAGTVELVASLLQMREGKLHPTVNLEDPINPDFNWVKNQVVNHNIKNALKLSMGFGGINTALCIHNVN